MIRPTGNTSIDLPGMTKGVLFDVFDGDVTVEDVSMLDEAVFDEFDP